MSTIKEKITNNKFLLLVLFIYITLAILIPGKALQSFTNSLYYIKEMVIIMPVILLLTSLIQAWVPKKTIENALGEGSGFKGTIFSFLLGSFSAGPIYAAFPVCKMLLKKGASVANIVIILSTWAVIKIPMLANEAKFLGPKFMFSRWILTTIAIFIMAYITSILVKKHELPQDDIKDSGNGNRLYVDEQYCIGCGVCTKLSPNNFTMGGKKVKFSREIVKSEESEDIKTAIEKCPTKAIKYQ